MRAGILASMFFESFLGRQGGTGKDQIRSPLKFYEMFDVFLYDFEIHTPIWASPTYFQVFQRYMHWVWGDASE